MKIGNMSTIKYTRFHCTTILQFKIYNHLIHHMISYSIRHFIKKLLLVVKIILCFVKSRPMIWTIEYQKNNISSRYKLLT